MFYFCHSTQLNYSLISHTDQAIFEAVQDHFPDVIDCYLDDSNPSIQNLLNHMHQSYLSGQMMVHFDANGKTPFHLSPRPVERHRISYFSDAPYGNFYKYVSQIPKGMTVTYSDLNFLEFFQDMNLGHEYIFLPHSGPNGFISQKSMAEKAIEIGFVGRISLPEPAGAFESILQGSDERLIKIVKLASEAVLEDKLDIYKSFKKYAQEAGYHPLEILEYDQLHLLLQQMTSWAEMHNRLSVLRSFKNTQLHIAGPVYDEVEGVTDKSHKFYGMLNGNETIRFLSEVRISLNPVSVFPGGSHERIWFAAASGAVSFSDRSSYLEQTLRHGRNIFYIDYNNLMHQAEQITHVSKDLDKLTETFDELRYAYLASHTWKANLKNAFSQMQVVQEYKKLHRIQLCV